MTASSFITRLNWRLILLNFAACWFFAYGFNLLSYLSDMEILRWALSYHNGHEFPGNHAPENFAKRIADFDIWIALAPIVGELAAFLIALVIALKKRWFWLNSFIAFLATFLLIRFHLSGWRWLKFIFLTPGELFHYPSVGYLITNGSILLIFGLLCLFLPATNQFIEGGFRQKIGDAAPTAEADNETN